MSKRSVRLNSKDRRALRQKLFAIQDGLCLYCQEPFYEDHPRLFSTFDHIIPRILNGKCNESNLVLCHDICNLLKSDKSLIEALLLIDRLKRDCAKEGKQSLFDMFYFMKPAAFKNTLRLMKNHEGFV